MSNARELCSEFGVMGWSFNELGRRADITKSNLYRYFSSREDVLLVLMNVEIAQFTSTFVDNIKNKPLSINEFSAQMARTYQQRPFLCDLLSVSATVLEQNVDLDSIRRNKLSNFEHHQALAKAIESCLQKVDFNDAMRIAFVSGVIVMGLWPIASPQASVRPLAKMEGLESLALDFYTELSQILEAQINGLINKQK